MTSEPTTPAPTVGLRDRIAQALDSYVWKPGHDWSELSAHKRHRYDGTCGICRGDVSMIADVAAEAMKAHTQEAQEENQRLRADLASATSVQVWPLARVLADVRCGSQDWTWDEEWADLDRRHATTGYLDTLDQQIQANGITTPVLIGSDGRLWDGHHRLRIAVRQGIPYVPVEIVPGKAEAAGE